MSDVVQEFIKAVGPKAFPQLAANLNMSPQTVQQLVPQIVPLILTGLKKQKDEFGGEARIDHIIKKYGNLAALADPTKLFADKAKAKPDPTLGGLLGNAGVQAVQLLAGQYKLKTDQIAQLITLLSPLVLGFLAQKRDSGTGLSGVAALLDRNGDGSILDDVVGFLSKSAGSQIGAADALGSLLGGLLKKKK